MISNERFSTKLFRVLKQSEIFYSTQSTSARTQNLVSNSLLLTYFANEEKKKKEIIIVEIQVQRFHNNLKTGELKLNMCVCTKSGMKKLAIELYNRYMIPLG